MVKTGSPTPFPSFLSHQTRILSSKFINYAQNWHSVFLCWGSLAKSLTLAHHWPSTGGTQLRGCGKPLDTDYWLLLNARYLIWHRVTHQRLGYVALPCPCHALRFLTYVCSDYYIHSLENHEPKHPSLITSNSSWLLLRYVNFITACTASICRPT